MQSQAISNSMARYATALEDCVVQKLGAKKKNLIWTTKELSAHHFLSATSSSKSARYLNKSDQFQRNH